MEFEGHPSALHARGNTGLGGMTVMSLIIHGVGMVAIYFLASWAPRLTPPPQSVLVTKLVRLGEPRPKELLPQKETPPPPPPPPAAPNIAPPPAPQPPTPTTPPAAKAPVKAPTVPSPQTSATNNDQAAATSKTNQALERLKKRIGTKDGSADGEVSDAELQVIGNRYATELQACLRANFELQGFMDRSAAASLTADVLVRIRRDGTIISARVQKSSGTDRFDRFAERAAQRCHKISPPPPELRSIVQGEGILITFTPM